MEKDRLIENSLEFGAEVAHSAKTLAINGLNFVIHHLKGGAWGNDLQESVRASITHYGVVGDEDAPRNT